MGGKLTTFRSMAADVVDHALDVLASVTGERPAVRRTLTDRTPLPGGETAEWEPFRREALNEGIPERTVARWLRLYGTEIAALVRLARTDPVLAEPIVDGHPALFAEVAHACRREMAMTLEDIMVRRTHIYYEVAGHGRARADAVAAVAARELGWDDGRVADEVRRYRER